MGSIQISEEKEHSAIIGLPTLHGLLFMKADQIIAFIADGSYTKALTMNEETHIITKSIGLIESKLQYALFFRIHHSIIINLKAVIKIERGKWGRVMLKNGEYYPISRRRKTMFLDQIPCL